MPNNPAKTVRNEPATDPRVRRSTRALGAALVELMAEDKFDDITVQDILDRAGVGRATFYSHFRNKNDVLHSSYEHMFSWLETKVDEPSGFRRRIVPVREFIEHIGDSTQLVRVLRESGQMREMSELGVEFLARMIEKRIRPIPGAKSPVPAPLVSRMLAGALMQMIEWHGIHHEQMIPASVDATFHGLANTWLRGASYEVRP